MRTLWRTELSGMDKRMMRAVYGLAKSKWKRKLLSSSASLFRRRFRSGRVATAARHGRSGDSPAHWIGNKGQYLPDVTLGRGDI